MTKARGGMTLVEVMVALGIAGIALAAGASTLAFLVDQQSRSEAESIAAAATTRGAVRSWIAAAQLGPCHPAGNDGPESPCPSARFYGVELQAPRLARGDNEKQIDNRRASVLEFVTSAPTPVARGGAAQTQVRLFVEPRNASGDALVAELRALPAGAPYRLDLARDVSGFEVRYRASVFGTPSWLGSWVSTSVLPAVVELRVTANASDVSASVATIPMTVLVGERR